MRIVDTNGLTPTDSPVDLGPRHVAIIMDGNGRWAKERSLPRLAGHRAGTEQLHRIIRALTKHGVEYVTLYAFSTENWDRPAEEVQGLLDILQEVIKKETQELRQQGVRIRHLGNLDRLSPELREAVYAALELTKDNTTLTLCVAFDYGGRSEILYAVKRILDDGLSPAQIDEATFARYLFSPDIPDPDLIIRTGGEQRLSNFLLWQSAYSEYYYTQAYWPDFDEKEVHKALLEYSRRQRRFGKVT